MDEDLARIGLTVNAVPHIRCDKYGTSWDLVIAEPSISLLQLLHGFTVDHNYDPTCRIDGEVRVFGALEAQRMARRRFLDAALDAITEGWGPGPAWCYRRLAILKGLAAQLESMLSCKDQESVSPIFSCSPTPSILA